MPAHKPPRTRLNQKKRRELLWFALDKIAPDYEDKLDAYKERVQTLLCDAYASAPEDDLAVLRRYDATRKVREVHLGCAMPWERTVLLTTARQRAGQRVRQDAWTLERTRRGLHLVWDDAIETPKAWYSGHTFRHNGRWEDVPPGVARRLAVLVRDRTDYESGIADVLTAYAVLVYSAKFLDEITKVWPEAADCPALKEGTPQGAQLPAAVTGSVLDTIRGDIARRASQRA